jgi:hypothetical protein
MQFYTEMWSTDLTPIGNLGLITLDHACRDCPIIVVVSLVRHNHLGGNVEVQQLDDGPLAGQLFCSGSRTCTKAALMAFARPIKACGGTDKSTLSHERDDFIRSREARCQTDSRLIKDVDLYEILSAPSQGAPLSDGVFASNDIACQPVASAASHVPGVRR